MTRRHLGTFTKVNAVPPAGSFTIALVIGYLLVAVCCAYAAVRMHEASIAQTQGERV